MFLNPCLNVYQSVLILIYVLTLLLVADDDSFFHCNNALAHRIYDLSVMGYNKQGIQETSRLHVNLLKSPQDIYGFQHLHI